jgi:hypothetical protein
VVLVHRTDQRARELHPIPARLLPWHLGRSANNLEASGSLTPYWLGDVAVLVVLVLTRGDSSFPVLCPHGHALVVAS